jgi:hypothetical protein
VIDQFADNARGAADLYWNSPFGLVRWSRAERDDLYGWAGG